MIIPTLQKNKIYKLTSIDIIALDIVTTLLIFFWREARIWIIIHSYVRHVKLNYVYYYMFFSLTHMLYKIFLLPFINISNQKWFINFSKNYLVFKRCFLCVLYIYKKFSYLYNIYECMRNNNIRKKYKIIRVHFVRTTYEVPKLKNKLNA